MHAGRLIFPQVHDMSIYVDIWRKSSESAHAGSVASPSVLYREFSKCIRTFTGYFFNQVNYNTSTAAGKSAHSVFRTDVHCVVVHAVIRRGGQVEWSEEQQSNNWQ